MKILSLFLLLISVCCNFFPAYEGPQLGEIVSPNGGEYWKQGSIQTIEWTGSGNGNVKVYAVILAGVNANQMALLGGGRTSGKINWKVGTTSYYGDLMALNPGPYQIMVKVDEGNNYLYDHEDPIISPVFTITK